MLRMIFRDKLKSRIKYSLNTSLNYASIEELFEVINLLRKIESNQLYRLINDEIIRSILKEDNELFNRLAQ